MTSQELPVLTLADLGALIAKDATLPKLRRRDVCSSLRAVARAMDRRAEEIPAQPAPLRRRLSGLTAAHAGVSPRRWSNIKSDVGVALRHAGVACRPGRSSFPLSAAWMGLGEKLAKRKTGPKYLWNGISAFARWCSERGTEPCGVVATTFEAFRDDINVRSVAKEPELIWRRTGQCWSEAAKHVPDWPEGRAALPDHSRKYILPWEAFPATLKAEFNAYLAAKTCDDIMGEFAPKPIRPSSVQAYTYSFRQYLAKLVGLGTDPRSLARISDVLDPRLIHPGLLAFVDPEKRRSNSAAHSVAMLLRALAVWSKAPETIRERLSAYCRRLQPELAMSVTTQNRLRTLEDPKLMHSLARLPSSSWSASPLN